MQSGSSVLFLAILIVGIGLLLAGCAGSPQAAESTAVQPAEPVAGAEAAASGWVQPSWEYPIAAGVWYPGDGPLPEHPFKYYRTRCWPGCHDPNSQPRPQH